MQATKDHQIELEKLYDTLKELRDNGKQAEPEYA